MSYTDVISLSEAKNYLRIDLDFTEDDDDLQMMIESALEYAENFTNHLVFEREKTYYRSAEQKRITIYDYPVNSDLADRKALHFSLRHEFDEDKITLSVGYNDPKDVPRAIINASLQMIDNWYYNHEKEANTSVIPEGAKELLWSYKRGIVG